MYIASYVHTCLCVFACVYIFACARLCVCTCVCACMCGYAHIRVCLHNVLLIKLIM